MFVVFDLDGTLADDSARQHFIEGEERDWDSYFAACGSDTPIWPTVGLFQMFVALAHRVEIWTGRSEKVRAETEEWLRYHVVDHTIAVKMRPECDYRPDTELKGQWLAQCLYARPDLILDDRAKSVAFWREQGITCYDVAGHGY